VLLSVTIKEGSVYSGKNTEIEVPESEGTADGPSAETDNPLNGESLSKDNSPSMEEEKGWDDESEDWDAKDDENWLATKVGAVAAKAVQFVSPNAAEEDILVEEQTQRVRKNCVFWGRRGRGEKRRTV